MRLLRGAAATAALATFLLTACGGGSSATSTPPPAPTAVPAQVATAAATAVSGSSPAGAANAACPTGVAANAPTGGTVERATGTIGTINGTTFTLTQRDNSSVTVMTDTSTRYEMVVPANASAIAVGDFITAQGATNGDAVTATTITDTAAQPQQQGGGGGNGQRPGFLAGCPPQGAGQQAANGSGNGNGPGNGRGFIAGTVQQVNGTTITIGTMLGTTTLTTDANTKVMRRQAGQFTDLKVGDQVMATAGRAANGGTAGTAHAASATSPRSFTAALVTDQTAH